MPRYVIERTYAVDQAERADRRNTLQATRQGSFPTDRLGAQSCRPRHRRNAEIVLRVPRLADPRRAQHRGELGSAFGRCTLPDAGQDLQLALTADHRSARKRALASVGKCSDREPGPNGQRLALGDDRRRRSVDRSRCARPRAVLTATRTSSPGHAGILRSLRRRAACAVMGVFGARLARRRSPSERFALRSPPANGPRGRTGLPGAEITAFDPGGVRSVRFPP